MIKVLVAYASKYHATEEIAVEIGKILSQRQGLEVDVKEASIVTDLTPYGAVVLGSAVYVGQWQAAASDLLKNHEKELSHRAVWLFSSGPTGEGDPKELLKGWDFPDALRPIVENIKPRDFVSFHGNLDPKKLNFGERMIIKAMHPPTGDFRNWDAIHLWADRIGEAVQILALPEE